ncbi:transcription initiation factor IID, 31kD subunit-domain-containing protein [Boeremia exigua]|uniref:transcription initiation factor IID, 31kD subunit-domain-containing protein n=1 Tax=Boeremia exigua TaxID=749465 RepID=UPI001E8E3669|nr:transcription initiation factor IID, 31kD subunit-domain-containing protein [Boeremia exigua]KAH6642837.1 transcription initiation factor IID, 31kD subunit-domain-containing protein [Boeremia exigua]
MASPAPDTNGISTPPATATAHTTSPPASQPHSAAQPPTTTTAPTGYPPTSLLDTGASKRPRDARLLHLLLANMGVSAYTERVPLQLLDFAYRYTSGVLSDALSYEPAAPAAHEKKRRGAEDEGVGLAALRTSVAARAAGQGVGLGREGLAEVASERNRVALPRVEREFGVRLPPERYCFTGVGWGVGSAWEEDGEEGDGGVGGPVGGDAVGGEVFGGAVEEDTEMGGMGEVDEEEFEEAMM